jgi:REP element-mobilizing transposase RayT
VAREIRPGAIVHVGSRGVDRRTIFEDDEDRRTFMSLLATAVREGRLRSLNHCLMGNHYHLVVEALDEPLGPVMRDLLGGYARGFNQRHGREGHLFERRFWSACVTSLKHMVALARYAAYNPVAAGLCRAPDDWAWSAHRELVGIAPAGVTDVAASLDRLGGRENYVRLVAPFVDERERALCELRAAIDPEWRREAIVSAHAAGCAADEIAEAASCSVRTVQRRVRDKNV